MHDDASWSALISALADASVSTSRGTRMRTCAIRCAPVSQSPATRRSRSKTSSRARIAAAGDPFGVRNEHRRSRAPEESVSLSTGFLQFGFAGVIASQWAVADSSTFLLMTRFYALWRRDRMDPGEALRQRSAGCATRRRRS